MTRFYPLLFVLLWSTGFIGAKFGLPYAEPITFLCVRYGLVIGLMGLVALATRAPWPADRRQWLHIGITGLLVHALYLGGVFSAIRQGLPAGITALSGRFYGGDVVELRGPDGTMVGRGVVAYDAGELGTMIGRSTSDLPVELRRPAVHADDLVAV